MQRDSIIPFDIVTWCAQQGARVIHPTHAARSKLSNNAIERRLLRRPENSARQSVARFERAVLGDCFPDGIVFHHQLAAVLGNHDFAVSHLHAIAGGIKGNHGPLLFKNDLAAIL